MPGRLFRRLILVETNPHDVLHFTLQPRPVEFCRRIVNWVCTDDESVFTLLPAIACASV
jgi:hypothetical protein